MEPNGVESLAVFQRAYKLSLDVHKATLSFPKVEQYALADQMRRASKAICATLSEGYGKKAPIKSLGALYLWPSVQPMKCASGADMRWI